MALDPGICLGKRVHKLHWDQQVSCARFYPMIASSQRSALEKRTCAAAIP